MKIFFISLSTFIISYNLSLAQDLLTPPPVPYNQQFDLKDMLKDIFGKNKTTDSSALNPSKELRITILPGVAYNPATDIVIGVSGNASWYYGNPVNIINSSVNTGVSYTTKNQLKISIQSNIFTNKNEWLIAGDWRFWKYVQDTYGLGTGTPDANSQNMDFNFIRFNQNVLRENW
ncbi:MAG: hypothetical protein M3R36_14855 [Bacteroidota bacterium]|nr:hypothetical protein [Bacteroidota bacterium]